MLPVLPSQIGAHQAIANINSDGAYDTKACHEAIARRCAHAIIAMRHNGQAGTGRRPRAAARTAILHAMRRLARQIWTQWTGWHRRNPVASRMRCFKLPGERGMASDCERQVAALPIRAAILHRCTRLGALSNQEKR